MSKLKINEQYFLDAYTKDRAKQTSNAILKEFEGLDISNQNFETALELGSNFMYHFGRTNKEEIDKFILDNQVKLAENKFIAIFNKTFKVNLDVDVDFEKIRTSVLDNYKVSVTQAAAFLKDIGIESGYINTFEKNAEKLREVSSTFVKDYFYYTEKEARPEELAGKHLFRILKEMPDDYDNVTVSFRDNKDWKTEIGMVVLPKKGMMIHGGTSVDLINKLGGGYEISKLVQDQDFFKEVKNDLRMGYKPSLVHPIFFTVGRNPTPEQLARQDSYIAEMNMTPDEKLKNKSKNKNKNNQH